MAEGITGEFNIVDPDFSDPSLKLLAAEVASYQEQMDATNPPLSEVNERIAAFDARWPYLDQIVYVTGKVTTPVTFIPETTDLMGTPELECEVVETFINRTQMISRGFKDFMQTQIVAGEEVGERRVLGYLFQFCEPDIEPMPMRTRHTFNAAIAFPGEVAIDVPVKDRSLNSLGAEIGYFMPHVARAVNEAIFNAANPTEAITRLAGIEIDSSYTCKDALLALIHYVRAAITFDTKMPYSVRFSGAAYNMTASGDYVPAAYSDAQHIGYPQKFQLIDKIIKTGTTALIDPSKSIFGLEFAALGPDAAYDGQRRMLIPITDALRVESVRSIWFEE